MQLDTGGGGTPKKKKKKVIRTKPSFTTPSETRSVGTSSPAPSYPNPTHYNTVNPNIPKPTASPLPSYFKLPKKKSEPNIFDMADEANGPLGPLLKKLQEKTHEDSLQGRFELPERTKPKRPNENKLLEVLKNIDQGPAKPQDGYLPPVPNRFKSNKKGELDPHWDAEFIKANLEDFSFPSQQQDFLNQMLEKQMSDREQWLAGKNYRTVTQFQDIMKRATKAAFDGDFDYWDKHPDELAIVNRLKKNLPAYNNAIGLDPEDVWQEWLAERGQYEPQYMRPQMRERADIMMSRLGQLRGGFYKSHQKKYSYREARKVIESTLSKFEEDYADSKEYRANKKGEDYGNLNVIFDKARDLWNDGTDAIPSNPKPSRADQEVIDEVGDHATPVDSGLETFLAGPLGKKGKKVVRDRFEHEREILRSKLRLPQLLSVKEMLANDVVMGNLDPQDEAAVGSAVEKYRNPMHPDTRAMQASYAMQQGTGLKDKDLMAIINEPVEAFNTELIDRAERNAEFEEKGGGSVPSIIPNAGLFNFLGNVTDKTAGETTSAIGWTFDKLLRLNYAMAGATNAWYNVDQEPTKPWHGQDGFLGSVLDGVTRSIDPVSQVSGKSFLDSIDDMAQDPKNLLKPFDEGYQQLFRGSGLPGIKEDITPITFSHVIHNQAARDGEGDIYDADWYQHVAGFGLDLALDPLNYVGVGLINNTLKVPVNLTKRLAQSAVETKYVDTGEALKWTRLQDSSPSAEAKYNIDQAILKLGDEIDGYELVSDTQLNPENIFTQYRKNGAEYGSAGNVPEVYSDLAWEFGDKSALRKKLNDERRALIVQKHEYEQQSGLSSMQESLRKINDELQSPLFAVEDIDLKVSQIINQTHVDTPIFNSDWGYYHRGGRFQSYFDDVDAFAGEKGLREQLVLDQTSEEAQAIFRTMKDEEKLLDDIASGAVHRSDPGVQEQLDTFAYKINKGYDVNPATGTPVFKNVTNYRRLLDEGHFAGFKSVFDPVEALARGHKMSKADFLMATGFKEREVHEALLMGLDDYIARNPEAAKRFNAAATKLTNSDKQLERLGVKKKGFHPNQLSGDARKAFELNMKAKALAHSEMTEVRLAGTLDYLRRGAHRASREDIAEEVFTKAYEVERYRDVVDAKLAEIAENQKYDPKSGGLRSLSRAETPYAEGDPVEFILNQAPNGFWRDKVLESIPETGTDIQKLQAAVDGLDSELVNLQKELKSVSENTIPPTLMRDLEAAVPANSALRGPDGKLQFEKIKQSFEFDPVKDTFKYITPKDATPEDYAFFDILRGNITTMYRNIFEAKNLEAKIAKGKTEKADPSKELSDFESEHMIQYLSKDEFRRLEGIDFDEGIPVSKFESGLKDRQKEGLSDKPENYVDSLSADIEKNGLNEPIELVSEGDKVKIGDGHHRAAAILKTNLDRIPVRLADDDIPFDANKWRQLKDRVVKSRTELIGPRPTTQILLRNAKFKRRHKALQKEDARQFREKQLEKLSPAKRAEVDVLLKQVNEIDSDLARVGKSEPEHYLRGEGETDKAYRARLNGHKDEIEAEINKKIGPPRGFEVRDNVEVEGSDKGNPLFGSGAKVVAKTERKGKVTAPKVVETGGQRTWGQKKWEEILKKEQRKWDRKYKDALAADEKLGARTTPDEPTSVVAPKLTDKETNLLKNKSAAEAIEQTVNMLKKKGALPRVPANERLTINVQARMARRQARLEAEKQKVELQLQRISAKTKEEIAAIDAKLSAVETKKRNLYSRIEKHRVEAIETVKLTRRRLTEEMIIQFSMAPERMDGRMLYLQILGMRKDLQFTHSMFRGVERAVQLLPATTRQKFANYFVRPSKQLTTQEAILFRAIWEGKTPVVIAAFLKDLRSSMSKIPQTERHNMLTAYRNGIAYDGPNGHLYDKVVKQLDSLEDIWNGEHMFHKFQDIGSTTTTHTQWHEIYRFLPKEWQPDLKYLSEMRKVQGRITLDDLVTAIRQRGNRPEGLTDPYRLGWVMHLAASQARQLKAIRHMIKNTFGIRIPTADLSDIAMSQVKSSLERNRLLARRRKVVEELRDRMGWEEVPNIKVKTKTGTETVSTGLEGYLFPPEAAKDIRKLMEFTEPGAEANKLSKHIDTVMGYWKQGMTIYNPAYYVRNGIGEIMASWLDGVNHPKWYGYAYKVHKYAKGHDQPLSELMSNWNDLKHAFAGAKPTKSSDVLFPLAGGERVHVEDALRLYTDMGLGSNFAREDLGGGLRAAAAEGLVESSSRKKIAGLNARVHELGEGFEDWLRMAHFLHAMQHSGKGNMKAAAEYAASRVRRSHFDYTDFSQFEKTYMLRAFPFFKWTRRGAPLMLAHLFMTPGKMAAYPKAMDTLSGLGADPVGWAIGDSPLLSTQDVDEDKNGHLPNFDGIAPAWVRDFFAYQMQPADDDEYANYIRIQTPQLDGLNAAFSFIPQEGRSPLDMFGDSTAYPLLNPVIKTGLELGLNRGLDPDFPYDIYGGEYNKNIGMDKSESIIAKIAQNANPWTGLWAKLSKNGVTPNRFISGDAHQGQYRDGYSDLRDIVSAVSGLGHYQAKDDSEPKTLLPSNTPPVGEYELGELPLFLGGTPTSKNSSAKSKKRGYKGTGISDSYVTNSSDSGSGSNWVDYGNRRWRNFGHFSGGYGYSGYSGSSGYSSSGSGSSEFWDLIQQLKAMIDQGDVIS